MRPHTRTLNLAVALLFSGSICGQGTDTKPSFERDVLPALQAKCFACHSATKADGSPRLEPKGGLRLDGRQWIERGGDGEDAVVPGSLEESAVYTRTTLPADDSDFMPSKGDALSDAERDALKAWILAGADFGDWAGATVPDGTAETSRPTRTVHEPARLRKLRELSEGLSKFDLSKLPKQLAGIAQVTAASPNGALLRVSFRSHEDRVDNAILHSLSPFAERIAVLNLARTAVSDRGMKSLSRMKRLVRLDLSRTAIGDAGVKAIGPLPKLETLNLFSSKLSDAGLTHLAKLPALRRVYAWKTAVTTAGAQSFETAELVHQPDWPDGATTRRGR